MARYLLVTLTFVLQTALSSAADAPADSPTPKTDVTEANAFKNDDARTAYAYGYKIGESVSQIGMSKAEVKYFTQGILDAATGKNATVDMAVYLPKVNDFAQKRATLRVAAEKKKGAEFAQKFSQEPGAKSIPKGGWIKTVTEGKGARPGADDIVKVNYRGTLTNGIEFDSSYKRGEPATFPLGTVIPCWTNGVAMMKVGGKAKLVCPSDTAYGDRGQPPAGIGGGATLIFEIELLDVTKPTVKK